MSFTPEKEQESRASLLRAGYTPDETDSIVEAMWDAEGGRPGAPPQMFYDKPAGQQALQALNIMALPAAGGSLGRMAGRVVGGRVAPFLGSVAGQYLGGTAAGLLEGQTLPEAHQTGMVSGIGGGAVELGAGLLGRGMMRSGGIPKYAVDEVAATEGSLARWQKARPFRGPGDVMAQEGSILSDMLAAEEAAKSQLGASRPEFAPLAQKMRQIVDQSSETVWNMFGAEESRANVLRRFGRALHGQEEGSNLLRGVFEKYERVIGTNGSIAKRIEDLTLKSALSGAEQTEIDRLTKTIARALAYGAAGGYGAGDFTGALVGGAVGAYSPEAGKFLLATNRLLGRAAAGAGAYANISMQGAPGPPDPDLRWKLYRQAMAEGGLR